MREHCVSACCELISSHGRRQARLYVIPLSLQGIHASDQPPAQQGTQTALGSAKELGTAALQNAQTTLQQVKQSIEGAVPTGASAGSVGQAGKDRLVQASRWLADEQAQ